MKIRNISTLTDIQQIRVNMPDKDIKDVVCNSKKYCLDSVFVAVKGFKSDGHTYIKQVIENGACVVVLDNLDYLPSIPNEVDVFVSKNTRKTLGELSALFFGNPGESIKLVGVTGTNGKTSTATYIYDYFISNKQKCGLIGTIKHITGSREIEAQNTTPESRDIQELLYEMKNNGLKYAVSEVSSHALDLDRVYPLKFDTAIFTNLTRDHLDFHGNFENYYQAKRKLFSERLKNGGTAIINIDDEYGKRLFNEISQHYNTLTISATDENSSFYCKNVELHDNSTTFSLVMPDKTTELIDMKLLGLFNVYNIVSSAAALWSLGEAKEDIIAFAKRAVSVRGRFQTIKFSLNRTAVIDYAHTPDAIEKLLKVAREVAKGKLIAVFGAGGDRDKGKRPLMGEKASLYCDKIILTDDNPRSENPDGIIQDIEKGVTAEYEVFRDRAKAIERAIDISSENDWLIILGKGHENYQIYSDETVHFSDEEEILKVINSRGNHASVNG